MDSSMKPDRASASSNSGPEKKDGQGADLPGNVKPPLPLAAHNPVTLGSSASTAPPPVTTAQSQEVPKSVQLKPLLAALNPNLGKPPNQDQDVTTSSVSCTTLSSSSASTEASQAKAKHDTQSSTPVSSSASLLPLSQQVFANSAANMPATTAPVLTPITTAATTSSVAAVKRPPTDGDIAPPATPMDAETSSGVPKRKKIRKEKDQPGKQSQHLTEGKDTAGSGAASGPSESHGDAVSANGGPKVPPIKIVLQSHGPTSIGSLGSGGSGPGPSESESSNPSAAASGFPYVVSSTTPDTTPTTTTAPVPVTKADVSSKEPAVVVTTTATELAALQISTTVTPASKAVPILAAKTTSSSIPVSTGSGATPASAPISGPSVSKADSASSNDSRKDPVVKLETMIPFSTTSTSTPMDATMSKDEKKAVVKDSSGAPVVSLASAVASTAGPGPVPVPVSSSSNTSASAGTEESVSGSGITSSSTAKEAKEKPQRVTRSSHRIATKDGGGPAGQIFHSATPQSPGGGSPKTSACPSPNHSEPMDVGPCANQSKADPVVGESLELHPRKRKIKPKEPSATSSSSSSTSGEPAEGTQPGPSTSAAQTNDPPLLNCYEMFLNIRKQIDRRRSNLFPVQPKPPQGFKDYLMNRGTYVLASNSNAQLAVPTHNPPPSLPPQLKDMFIEQEKERHKLRIQQVVEKEKLVLSVEQEILRVHGRAARALSNQALPFSVCTILKDQEVYNLLTPEQEEKDRNARSRYNGRLFLSWLQDVDDKWDKIKENMLLRHHNEAESLHAVQKMDWEWKLKEVGLCEPKANPPIDEMHVPMVHVSDDFDLLPA